MAEKGLMDNNLLLYFLAGAGRAIGGDGSFADKLGLMSQQNIAAQSKDKANKDYIKMLRQMLSGGGKITLDKDNVKINAPANSLKDSSTNTNNQLIDMLGAGELNPLVSPLDTPSADLAGLTTKDVSQALSGALNVEQLIQSKINAESNRKLRVRELDILQGRADTDRLKALANLQKQFRTSPLSVPGVGKVTLDEWNALDTKTKAYSYYAFDAKSNDEKVLSFNEWNQQTDLPTAKQLYDLAMEDPGFNKWLTKYRKSGTTGTSLGEKIEQRKAFADIDAVKYFTDPKGLIEDINKYMSSKEVRRKLLVFSDDKATKDKKSYELKEKFIQSKINAAGGEILDGRLEGKTVIWTVKWPDGSTSEVKDDN